MPELPEVETTLRGIKPHISKQTVSNVIIRHPSLRWPIPTNLAKTLKNQPLKGVSRRAKYILFQFPTGTLILHLGMSGRVRILAKPTPPQKHDHVDIIFGNGKCLRFTDPRRFGALLWTGEDPKKHVLLKNIGPEPLSDDFAGSYLWEKAQGKKVAVKTFIMNGNIVAGVGNIYATEALFLAGIHPNLAAGELTKVQCRKLVTAIKKILEKAITKGGTTLKDFTASDGSPGYFSLELLAYGRAGKPCVRCGEILESNRLGQRSTVFCGNCQVF